jgi:hypothetical protein
MPRTGSVLLLPVLLTASVFGAVSGDPTVFDAGVWVQHPGIAVGKLRASDTQMTTLVGDTNGYLHAWYPNGTERTGFPKLINDQTYATSHGGTVATANYSVNSTPALVDINGDGDLEIFVGSGDGWVYGLKWDGTNLPGWPQFTDVSPPNHLYGVFASPAVADVDRDGTLEVIVGAWSHWLYVWKADGTLQWRYDALDTIWSSAAVADLDGDGYLEIVVGCDWTEPSNPVNGGGGILLVFRHNGTQLSGWPKYINQVIWSSPAIADIDNDGDLDIIVGTGNYYTNRPRYVNGYDWQGNALPGWPVTLPLLPGAPTPDSSSRLGVFASPALADVDSDGKLEVLVGDMFCAFHCINWDGSIRWSTHVGTDWTSFTQFSSPAVGDIDGDGGLEVVTGGCIHLFAFNALTGALKTGYPINTALPTGNPSYPMITWSSPTIADVDGDGLIEVLIGNGCKDWPGVADAGGVNVYHESGTAVPAGQTAGPTGVAWSVAPWPRFRRSNTGTGSLSDAANFTIGGYLGVGTETPQRAVHLVGPNAVFRMDRSADTAAFLLVRTDDLGNPLKTFVVGANASGPNQGEFIINDIGAAVGGAGQRRMTIANTGDTLFGGNVSATSFLPASSLGLKTNIHLLDNPLGKLKRLAGVRFDWKSTGQASLGVIGEQVAGVLPEVVSRERATGLVKGVSYDSLVALLLESSKAQQRQLETLRARREQLRRLLEDLTESNQRQEERVKP